MCMIENAEEIPDPVLTCLPKIEYLNSKKNEEQGMSNKLWH